VTTPTSATINCNGQPQNAAMCRLVSQCLTVSPAALPVGRWLPTSCPFTALNTTDVAPLRVRRSRLLRTL